MKQDPVQGDADIVQFIDDETEAPEAGGAAVWKVLIVDDDEQVHTSTVFALSDVGIQGRPLLFLHAYSAAQAYQILSSESEVAVALVDVVMESGHAGLKLVRLVREELGLTEMRIILRTGQPGYAPEIEAIRDYDINDYRTKNELTRTRLVTSLTAAIRSYEQIRTIAYSRQGLEKIVRAAAELFEKRAVESLAEGVLTQIASLLHLPPSGVVCARRGFPLDGSDPERLYVVGAVGRFAPAINAPLDSIGDPRIFEAIVHSMRTREIRYGPDHTVLYLCSPGGTEEAIYLESGAPLDLLDRQLLEVFATNISVGFSNVYLFHKLRYLAYYDPLTGLANRQKLVELVDESWLESLPGFSVFLLDIDHFSDINDVLGASFGDAILRAVAERATGCLPSDVHIGRYGGDVLCVLGRHGAVTASQLLGLFKEPFRVEHYQIPITVTLGEFSGSTRMDGMEALKNAGLALTQAKRARRGHGVAFTEQMAVASRARLDLTYALRQAVDRHRLHLFFQPQVALATGEVVGAEALLRWWADDGEEISPAIFIPLAEQVGLIRPIGEWVMEETCRQLSRWREKGLGKLRVAINVSAQQVRFGCCAPQLESAMGRHGVGPGQIEVEVTESMLLDDIEAAERCFRQFKDLGVKTAIDDFGIGFSSLSYLNNLSIDAIKIDRAFVRRAGNGARGGRIAEMIAALGRQLSLETIAEGVETDEQRAAAVAWGCSRAQGFFYAPAMRADEFTGWVETRRLT